MSVETQSNDAARILMSYLYHVGVHRSDEHFGANAKGADSEQRREMAMNCRGIALQMGLIRIEDGKIIPTAKGERFGPGRQAWEAEIKAANAASVPSA